MDQGWVIYLAEFLSLRQSLSIEGTGRILCILGLFMANLGVVERYLRRYLLLFVFQSGQLSDQER